MRVAGYLSRWDFILDHCLGRRVLHLGCVGETDDIPDVKVKAFRSKRVIHARLMEVAREVVGVDLDAETIKLIRSQLGTGNLVVFASRRAQPLAQFQAASLYSGMHCSLRCNYCSVLLRK